MGRRNKFGLIAIMSVSCANDGLKIFPAKAARKGEFFPFFYQTHYYREFVVKERIFLVYSHKYRTVQSKNHGTRTEQSRIAFD